MRPKPNETPDEKPSKARSWGENVLFNLTRTTRCRRASSCLEMSARSAAFVAYVFASLTVNRHQESIAEVAFELAGVTTSPGIPPRDGGRGGGDTVIAISQESLRVIASMKRADVTNVVSLTSLPFFLSRCCRLI